VLLVGPWPPTRGGVTTFMTNLATDPDLSARYDFRRQTTSRPEKRGTTENWGYGALFAGGAGRAAVAALVSLWHLLQFGPRVVAWRIDVVQVMASDFLVFWESALYVLYAGMLGRRTVMRLGGAFDRFLEVSSPTMRRLIGWCVRRPDRLIVQSEYWRRVVASVGRVEGVEVVNNWVADGLLARADRPPTARPKFLFIAGNEATRKGVDALLAAAAKLVAEGVAFRLTVVATPAPLVARVAVHPAAAAIQALPSLPHGEVLALLREADAFLLPSRGEGFPNSLVEAMAAGCAVVATPVGAVPEIFEDGRSGLITPVDDVTSLADAMRRIATDRDLRLALGAAGRTRVETHFTASAVRPVFHRLYGDLAR
jgi:glycosyltransferase involved in cell wall biosynthesis